MNLEHAMNKTLVYKDFTIKALLRNRAAVLKIIQGLNAECMGLDKQTDHYFRVSRGKLKYREGSVENLITHYERVDEQGIERTIVYRYDIDPAEELIGELFRRHHKIGITVKERMIFKAGNIKIHIDKLPGGEEFIEIEAIDAEGAYSVDDLRDQCLMMRLKLEIQETDLIKTGYF